VNVAKRSRINGECWCGWQRRGRAGFGEEKLQTLLRSLNELKTLKR
jgi:hypothetical protein